MKIDSGISAINFHAKFTNTRLIKDIDAHACDLGCAKKYQRAKELIERIKKDDEISIEVHSDLYHRLFVTFNDIKRSKIYKFSTNTPCHPYTFATRSIIQLSKLLQNK